jgi:hypothetical protein
MTIDWDGALNAGSKVYTEQNEYDGKRGVLERAFAPLGNYSIINGLYNLTDDDPNTGFFGGAIDALEYMNPLDNNVPEIHTTSDVLGNLGWNPESLPGKIARGVVGFAGDVVLDPLTYFNPFTSLGKVMKGTGTVVKAIKGLKEVKPLTTRQAKIVVDTFYKQRGINPAELDVNDYIKEVKDLQTSFNEKIMKVKQGGQGLEFGGANIPFSDKIKIGDKTLDSFTKTFVTGDQLRAFGDATVAPYYNQLATKIRNTKAMQKFNKYGDLQKLAETNPMQASAILKLNELIKGMDKTNIDSDLKAMEDANFIDTLTVEEEEFLKDFILSGDWKDVKIAESMISKIKNQGVKIANQMNGQQSQKDTLQKELDKVHEQLTKLAGQMGKPKKSKIDNFGNQFYIDRILNMQPASKLEVAEIDANTMFNDMINDGQFDNDIRSYMQDIIARDRVQPEIPQELVAKREEALTKYNQSVKEVADNQKYRYEELINTIEPDVEQYNRITKILQNAIANKQKDRIPALTKRQKDLEERIIATIEMNGGDKNIFYKLDDFKQSVATAKDRMFQNKTALSDLDNEIKDFKTSKSVNHINTYDDNTLLELGKKNEEVLIALRSNFDENKGLSKEYNTIGFTVESKKAVVDELNKAIFGEKRKVPVIQYDIDDTILENIVKAIEAKDAKTAIDLLHDSVLQYNWNRQTFDKIYSEVSSKFPFSKYGLNETAKIRTTPHIKHGKNVNDWEYFDLREIPDLISKYEMGEKQYGGLLYRVAQELKLAPKSMIFDDNAVSTMIANLKSVKSSFWKDYSNQAFLAKKSLAERTGAKDLRQNVANSNLMKDAKKAMQIELKNPYLDELPTQNPIQYDQYFDYQDINGTGNPYNDLVYRKPIDVFAEEALAKNEHISEEEFKHMYDHMTYRISKSLGGRQIEQVSPDELAMFKDIDEIENSKFGVNGKITNPLIGRPIHDENDMIDEYIFFMKEKGKDTRYPDRNINRYDNILADLKDNGNELKTQAMQRTLAIKNGLEYAQHMLTTTETKMSAINKKLATATHNESIPLLFKLRELDLERNNIKNQLKELKMQDVNNVVTKEELMQRLADADNELDKLIQIQTRIQDSPTALQSYYRLEEEMEDIIAVKGLLKKRIDEINVLTNARKVLDEQVPITQRERANFYNLTPFQQQMIAENYKKYQENRFIKMLENSSDSKIAKMIATTKKPEVKAEMEQYLKRRTAKMERQQLDEQAKAQKIENLKKMEEDLTKKLQEFSTSDANRTAFYYLSNDYVRDQLSVQMGKTIEEVDRLMELRKNGKMIDMAKFWTDRMNEIGQTEVNIGKMQPEQFEAWKDKYIPLVVSDEGLKYFMEQATREHNGKFNPETFGVGIRKKFDQHRTYETIEEANKAMKEQTGIDGFFETELADIFQSRAIGHNELLFNEEMTNAIRHIFGKDYKPGEAIKGYSPTITYNDLRKRMYDKWVAEGGTGEFKINDADLQEMGINPILFSPNMQYIKLTEDQVKKIAQKTSFVKPDGKGSGGIPIFNLKDELHPRLNKQSRIQKAMLSSELTNFYDKFLHIYKMWNSAMFPGFHAQNMASNAFQSFMSSGRAILDPKKYKQAHAIFTHAEPNKTINFKGRVLTYAQVSELANKYGILDNTFFKEDIAISADAQGYFAKKGLSPKVDPTDINNFVPYKVGKEVGATIEGTQRLVLFIHNLEEGMDIPEAVANVNKFLFDYSDLTEFEKDTMKRIIPFYTYMRKNVPLQLEQMLENPALYANVNKIINNFESMSGDNLVEDKDRNPWRKEYVQLPYQVDGQNIGFNPQLPYQQLERLTLPRLIGQTSPLIKAPIELMTGEYAYTGIPIDSVGDYIASQTVPTRMLNQQADMEGLDKELYIAGQIAGFPMGTINSIEDWQR